MVEIGPWQAWPRSGGRDIDPYMRAYLARGVHLPLGTGEGLELIAERDEDGPRAGRALSLRSFGRGSDDARLDAVGHGWRRPLLPPAAGPQRLHRCGGGARAENGSLQIAAAAWPQAGDWLPLPTSGRFQFRLRLYDTPIATQAGETRPESLPRIERIECP